MHGEMDTGQETILGADHDGRALCNTSVGEQGFLAHTRHTVTPTRGHTISSLEFSFQLEGGGALT